MSRVKLIRPLKTDVSGRDVHGRFAPGNQLAVGNLMAHKVARFRNKLFDAVSMTDFESIVCEVTNKAKSGEAWACKLIFMYILGKPLEADLLQRINDLEQRMQTVKENL